MTEAWEIPDADRQDQQRPISPTDLDLEPPVLSRSTEVDDADRLDQAIPVPLDDEEE